MQITLKMARHKTGYSQDDMAKLLGTNRNTYAQYENYETPMRINTAFKFCEITNTDIDDVIFFKE